MWLILRRVDANQEIVFAKSPPGEVINGMVFTVWLAVIGVIGVIIGYTKESRPGTRIIGQGYTKHRFLITTMDGA